MRQTPRCRPRRRSPLLPAALLVAALAHVFVAGPAAAHQSGMGMLLLDFDDDGVRVGLRLDGTVMSQHLGIIDELEDGLPTIETVEANRAIINRYLAEHLRMRSDEWDCEPLVLDEMALGPAESHYLDVVGNIECGQRLGEIEFFDTVLLDVLPDYQTLGILRTARGRLETTFSRNATSVRVPIGPPLSDEERAAVAARRAADGTGAAPDAGGPTGTAAPFESTTAFERVVRFIGLGIEHIVPKGTDHILFIIGLTVAAVSFRRLLGVVTAFTLSHSITLGLAAFEIIVVPIAIAEAAIALSVAWVGLENLVHKPKGRWLLAFVFGLIHGIGFSSVLGDLVAGTDVGTGERVQQLLGFNVGVELGQILVVAAVFPLLLLARRFRKERWLVWPVSLVVFGFGMVWFVERVGSLV